MSEAKEFEGERIAKAIARAGICSRRDAEAMILEGRVWVNGKKLASPALNVTAGDDIRVDGKPLPQRENTRLFRYYKPRGLVTTAKDPEGRPTVFDSLPKGMPRVISVGRLDLNSEGLLLLTNDGELARKLELPATGWVRRYRVRVNGAVEQKHLDQLARGVEVEGVRYGPIEAVLDRNQGANAWITMALTEGKNREIRKICGHFGWPVSRLIRVAFGPFQIGHLEKGDIEEVPARVLREQTGQAKNEGFAAKKEPAKPPRRLSGQLRLKPGAKPTGEASAAPKRDRRGKSSGGSADRSASKPGGKPGRRAY
jgi:23S rRNA pseudouridine2605 synthase